MDTTPTSAPASDAELAPRLPWAAPEIEDLGDMATITRQGDGGSGGGVCDPECTFP